MPASVTEPVATTPAADRPQDGGSQAARIGGSSVYDLLSAQARRDASAVAILAPGRTPLDFGGLLNQIDYVRTALNGCGLGRGDRIAILGARGPETAVALLGIACCATCVPLNSAAPVTELERGLVETGAKALLVPETASVEVRELASRLGLALLEYTVEEGAPTGRFRMSGSGAGAVARGGPAAAEDIAFVLRTSGTTSRAKIVPIRHRNAVARTEKARRLFDVSAADLCLNLMPLCYHQGINTGLMLPLVSGCAVILPSAFNAETYFACMRDFSPTWYTASFTYHQAILEWLRQRPDALTGNRLRYMRAASGPLPAHVRIGVEELLGAPLLAAYGTTETGTVAANSPVGKRKPGTVGSSGDDSIAVVDESGRPLPAGTAGEVVVRGATVFEGYENDPAANQRVFRGEWYRTGDQGVIDDDGCIKLLGRVDDIINRGGEKISPQEVDEALLAHEAVAEAVSFPVPHTLLHQEIAAAVVLRSGAQATGLELRRFLATRLAPFKVPRVILCTAELPKGPTGKVSRTAMAAHFGLMTEAAPVEKVESLTETQRIVLGLWRDVLKRQDIGCDDDFFLSGGDSLSAVDLLHRIEEKLQYQLPLDILMEAPTVRQLEERLVRATRGAINNVIKIHAAGNQRPLFAVSGSTGHCMRLFAFLRGLGADQPCYGLQPPGMDWDSVACTTIPEMAAHYLSEVRAIQPRGPYRLFGSSFGGVIVFEMALQLQSMGEQVEFLAMLDTNPTTCLFEGGIDVGDILSSRLVDGPDPKERLEALNHRVERAHARARRDYVVDGRLPRNVYRGELVYLYCTGNPIVARSDRRRLWQRFAPNGFRLLPLPGLHGACDREPQFTPLQDLLRACLRGELPRARDPAIVFGRTYRIESTGQRQSILSSTGEEYDVDRDAVQGYLDSFSVESEVIRFQGWAVEPCQNQPAQTIAVFLGDRFLGYGASGTLRSDLSKQFTANSTEYAGFELDFRRAAVVGATGHPRLFVLSSDGHAAELRLSDKEEARLLRAKLDESERSARGLLHELDAVRSSTSWRITRPIRQIRRVVRSVLGR
jgi:oxalate---CoA ligase